MKNIKILLLLIATSAMLGSCIKEEFPENGAVSADQAAEALDATTAGLHAWMSKYNVLGYPTNQEQHFDFGYGALMMQREFMGQDVVQVPEYWNWRHWQWVLGNLGPDYVTAQFPWRWYYRLILLANTIISADNEGASEGDKQSIGIAYVYRAMAYFDLVRLYLQGNYVDNSDGPSVPIVTETMSTEDTRNNPRAKASDVYTLILADLQKAAEYLVSYNSGNDKIMPNEAVAKGMLARVYLEMGNWTEAKNHAAEARAGYSPLTAAQWRNRQTGFNDPNNPSWMWCFTNTNNDDVVQTGILCWAANMSTENVWGYSGPAAGNYVMIDAHLYSLINDTDFRKNSWKDPRSPQIIPNDSAFPYSATLVPAYSNFKFRPGSGDFGDYVIGNSVSIPLMRMEEMMLIEAEAAGRLSVADGVALLNTFAQTRDASYSSTATTVEQFIEDVWLQRRIELWGEGFGGLDLKRLNKGVIRNYAGSNHHSESRFNTTEQPDWLDLVITRTEINANDGISQEQNNPTPIAPPIGAEHVW